MLITSESILFGGERQESNLRCRSCPKKIAACSHIWEPLVCSSAFPLGYLSILGPKRQKTTYNSLSCIFSYPILQCKLFFEACPCREFDGTQLSSFQSTPAWLLKAAKIRIELICNFADSEPYGSVANHRPSPY